MSWKKKTAGNYRGAKILRRAADYDDGYYSADSVFDKTVHGRLLCACVTYCHACCGIFTDFAFSVEKTGE